MQAQQDQLAGLPGLVQLLAEGFGLWRGEAAGEGSMAVMIADGCYQVRLAKIANFTCAVDWTGSRPSWSPGGIGRLAVHLHVERCYRYLAGRLLPWQWICMFAPKPKRRTGAWPK